MLFESIKNLSISEKIRTKMSNSLNTNDNSMVLLLGKNDFDGHGLPVLATTLLVRI